jgi:hypothetical protein
VDEPIAGTDRVLERSGRWQRRPVMRQLTMRLAAIDLDDPIPGAITER